MSRHNYLYRMRVAAVIVVVAVLLAACASMGRPTGGPRDVEPPQFVRSTPAAGALDVDGRKITVEFNENIQLDDPQQKIVISPAQKQTPQISSNGRRVTIELRDSLLPNTTYTIDFADAVKDLNEGNVLDGFAIDFSTGPVLDSLRISGMVFQADNLEPAQGMLVGAYLDRGDTAIQRVAFDRITKTNQLGQFTLRNLKPGAYRVYALNDNNRDYHWDRSEDVAFLDSLVHPVAQIVWRTDSVHLDDGVDSVMTWSYTRYLPNNLILTWFNQNYKPQYLAENSRATSKLITLTFGAPSDTLPELRLLNGPRAGQSASEWAVLAANPTLDSLQYWIKDSAVVAQDSILLEARYLRTDSLDNLVPYTDTLKLNVRRNPAREKEAEKLRKKAIEQGDTLPKMEYIDFRFEGGGQMDLNRAMTFTSATPIASIDSSGVHMEMLVDTLWTAVEPPVLAFAGQNNPLAITAKYKWTEGTKYRLTVDSAAVADIYGLHNKAMVSEFTTLTEADYSTLYFNVSGLERGQQAFIQLLSGSDKPVAASPVSRGAASFTHIKPGDYFARLVVDSNNNAKWDTGLLTDSLQPEEVYYYPRKITLKKNWDVEQTWDLYSTSLDKQKPDQIKKNKPKPVAGMQPESTDEEYLDEEIDETAPGYNPFDPASRRRAAESKKYNNR